MYCILCILLVPKSWSENNFFLYSVRQVSILSPDFLWFRSELSGKLLQLLSQLRGGKIFQQSIQNLPWLAAVRIGIYFSFFHTNFLKFLSGRGRGCLILICGHGRSRQGRKFKLYKQFSFYILTYCRVELQCCGSGSVFRSFVDPDPHM